MKTPRKQLQNPPPAVRYLKKIRVSTFKNLELFCLFGFAGRSWYQNVGNFMEQLGKIWVFGGGAIFREKISKNWYFRIPFFQLLWRKFFLNTSERSKSSARILSEIMGNILVYHLGCVCRRKVPEIAWEFCSFFVKTKVTQGEVNKLQPGSLYKPRHRVPWPRIHKLWLLTRQLWVSLVDFGALENKLTTF